MLYHISSISGLKTIKPRISTHKKPYVYAVKNLITGLLFGAKHDDFDFIICSSDYEIPIISECYHGAFSAKFKNTACSIYEISENGFQEGMTNWDQELVCENEVGVLSETIVSDLYDRLFEEQDSGRLIIHSYQNSAEYKKTISKHIVDRLIRFDALDKNDIRFEAHYRGIIDGLNSIMDGHLLA